jgi:hypothetical protein
MKWSKKREQFEAANVTLKLEPIEAYSYGWWKFVSVINGFVVFNDYNYSPTTGRHQYKVRRMLEEKGIKIDLEVKTHLGLNGNSRYNYGKELDALKSAIESDLNEIKELEEILANTRRKKALDDEMKEKIVELKEHIGMIERVIAPLPLDRALLEVV